MNIPYQNKIQNYMQAYITYWTTHMIPKPNHEVFGITLYDANAIRQSVQSLYDYEVKVPNVSK